MRVNRREFLSAGIAVAGATLLSGNPGPLFAATSAAAGKKSVARAGVGAEIPWKTCFASEMKTTGAVLGPKYGPNLVETESSGQRCVQLRAGQYVEFTVASQADALVVRYSLSDSHNGGGLPSTLTVYKNGKSVGQLPITSKYSWLYGKYPFTNDPRVGKPRNFFDEVRMKGLAFAKGDVIRLQKGTDEAAYCIIDLIDLEEVAPPLSMPVNSLSVMSYGAGGNGQSDDTEALRKCIADAATQGKIAWVPSGEYKVTGEVAVPSGVTLQGAGMWHTTFVGDEEVYLHANRRVKFTLTGNNIHLADFAIVGKLSYRNDDEPNDGIIGAGCSDSTISRVWVEHTKVGMWLYVCDNLFVEGCRFRNTLADGINLCVGTRNTIVQNCTTRNTGDDCFAIWPAASDQGFVQKTPLPGNNVIRHCTGQLPFLANGGAIYGGVNNRIEDCLFTDISAGCGILLSTTFSTADEILKIDNNFGGTTVVRNCDLIRCGGSDHDWGYRAAFEVCMERRSISGVAVSNVNIVDSISDGLRIVGPGSPKGQGTLSDSSFENVNISNSGIGAAGRHGLQIREDARGSVTISNSQIADIQNSSPDFTIVKRSALVLAK